MMAARPATSEADKSEISQSCVIFAYVVINFRSIRSICNTKLSRIQFDAASKTDAVYLILKSET